MYILKEHQKYAVDEFQWKIPYSLESLHGRRDNKKAAITLQAPTGAGKTLIASEVLDGLVNGKYEGLEDCVVLYVSASPDLNQQTVEKIERFNPALRGRIVTIDKDFKQEELDPKKIYFINTQKLGKRSSLTKGDNEGSYEYNFWESWENACSNEEQKAVLFLDESHQGMSGSGATIAKRLIQGKNMNFPVPLVIGMSATPTKFKKVISQTHFLEEIAISMKDVKDSGLIKDTIDIHYPGEEKGDFKSILTEVAAKEYIKYEDAWRKWCKENEQENIIVPVLVVQVEDKITENQLGAHASRIADAIPSIDPDNSFAHNIMDFSSKVENQGVTIHQVDPSKVQDDTDVKVFFIKESAVAGWDCPRAEVLLSFRPHSDSDYIIQIMGRMLRTPLAQRIEGSDILNSTSVILPLYDLDKVSRINDRLQHGGVDGDVNGDDGFNVALNPVDVSCVNDELKDILSSLPSYTVPYSQKYSPLDRMIKVGLLLDNHGIIDDFEDDVQDLIVKEMVSSVYKNRESIDDTVNDLKIVQTNSTRVDNQGNIVSDSEIHDNKSNSDSIDIYLENASKIFGKNATRDAIKECMREMEVDDEEATYLISALSYDKDICESINEWAQNKTSQWISSTYSRDIKRMCSQEQKAEYNKLLSQSSTPENGIISLPERYTISSEKVENGKKVELPYIGDNKHLYSDNSGKFYYNLHPFEEKIILQEIEESGVVGFYRNPSSGSKALRVSYNHENMEKVFSPDFIIFTETTEGIKPSIVDPHGTYLEDSLDKLQGLARYAENHGDKFLEIRAISEEKNGKAKVLDMTEEKVRAQVLESTTIAQAYQDNGDGIVEYIDIE